MCSVIDGEALASSTSDVMTSNNRRRFPPAEVGNLPLNLGNVEGKTA